MLNVVELALNLWKHPHSRALLLCFLAPIFALFFYLAGVSSVDVDRANVCAPLLKDHRRLETQITELEALVASLKLNQCEGCAENAEQACVERLEAQLTKIKELRCKVCSLSVLP